MLLAASLLACAAASERRLASVDVNKPAFEYTHNWVPRAAMPHEASDFSATTVGDEIFLVGGCGHEQEWVGAAEWPGYYCSGVLAKSVAYVPATNTYRALPDAPRQRYRHSAVAVGTKVRVRPARRDRSMIVP